ncbi:unnamed protein product [Discula destructiva]
MTIDSPFASTGSKWIWTPDYNDTALHGQFVNFRKTFSLTQIPSAACFLHVSADTRYRLHLNGESVSFGPAKSYLSHWNYESVNITPYLRPGANVLAARVLRLSSSHDGCVSMIRSAFPGLIVSCEIEDLNIGTDLTWKTMIDHATKLVADDAWDYRLGPQFLRLNETVDGRDLQRDWLTEQFDDAAWPAAICATPQRKLSPIVDPWRLVPRSIPVLPEILCHFDGVVTSSEPSLTGTGTRLLLGESTLVVPGNSKAWIEVESNTLSTGFIDLEVTCDGPIETPPKVTILYSECYENSMEDGKHRSKGDRTDFKNGRLYGLSDTYLMHNGANHYSPFWWRTFRYIRLTIDTTGCDSSVTLSSFKYRSTHYPLDISTTVQTSDAQMRELWNISVNTLRNCMHETYEDCPFYEQNQFAMDTRSMILFTYVLSRDDRLARKAMKEFYASRGDDGLIDTHFPCPARSNNIPTFSLFWVLMVHDHMVHFGDEALVRKYLGAIDDVLNFFHQRIDATTGLVGKFDTDHWAFVDWADGWFTSGVGFSGVAVPPAYFKTGSATFHTLLYAYALVMASELCTFLGRQDTAWEYLYRQDVLLQAVKTHCVDAETGFILDGPGAKGQMSQHCQVFAVLTGCVDGEAAKKLLTRTILQRAEFGLTKASFAMGFYVFRAASQAGVYDACWATLIQPWEKMMADNLTTWVESESMVRSDCHGWSATPLWEIATEILGVDNRCEAYIERVVKKQAQKGTVAMPVGVAPRTGLVVRGQLSGNVLVGPGPDDHVRVEVSATTKDVAISGQAARRECVQRDESWTLRQLD